MNSFNCDYSLTNSTLYPSSLLEKRALKLFVTIPHTDLSVSEAIYNFKSYGQIEYIKVAQEHHEDGDTHLHMFMSFKNQVRYSNIHNILIKAIEGKRIQGTVNYQVPKNSEAVCQYIDKEGNTEEFGKRPLRVGKTGRPNVKTGDVRTFGRDDSGPLEAISLAHKGDLAGAIEVLKETQPMRMLENLETITENLRKMNTQRVKYEVPIYTESNTVFKKWQNQLLDLVKNTPKKRRIIWVVGEPESGKTFIHDYLANIDNFQYGLFDAGQSVSYDNVVYGYDEEGIIAWDFPMNYDWETFEKQAGNIIEKFSDFGTQVSSKKYKGSTKLVRGHCIVFSNRPPLENLQHRDVITIWATKEEEKQIIENTEQTIKEQTEHNYNNNYRQKNRHTECPVSNQITFDNIEPSICLDNTQISLDKDKDGIKPPFEFGSKGHQELLRKSEGLNIRLSFLQSSKINEEEEELIIRRLRVIDSCLKQIQDAKEKADFREKVQDNTPYGR